MKWGLLGWSKHVGYGSRLPAWKRGKTRLCFDRDAPVFFRAKLSRNGNVSFLWPYITSFSVTGVCGIHGRSISGCPVSPAFLSSQGSHPASRELKSCIFVEAFLNRGHADADGFLEQQFTGMSGHVHHCGLTSLEGVLVLPCMFSYCRLLQCPFRAGFLVHPQLCLQPSSGLTNVDLAATAGVLVHNLVPLLHW